MNSSYRISSRRGNGKLKMLLIILAAFIVLLLGAVFTVRQVYNEQLKPVSNSQRAQLVQIESGASAKEIAALLEREGLIRAAWAFEWYVRNNDLRDKLQAGTYYVRPNQSVSEIAAVLSQGAVATDLVTILPAQRIDQIRGALINSGFQPGRVFIS